MQINQNHFCALSSSQKFLAWLYDFSPSLFNDVSSKLRVSRSCTKNAEIMIAAFRDITKNPENEVRLEAFLKREYPHVLIAEGQTQIQYPNEVLSQFSPGIVTLPRRTIVRASDVDKFIADKPISNHVIKDGVAYVEYLPVELAHLNSKIPSSNWLLRR